MNEIEIAGIKRDLRHLREVIVSVPSKGKDGADLRVAISYGLHTISTGYDHGQHDMFDENGKARLFSEDRYAFSLGSPELAHRMIEHNYFSWESADRNRAMNFAVIDVAPSCIHRLVDGTHQVVFFYLYPTSGITAHVNLVITRCHSREVALSRIKRRFNIHTLLRKCLYEAKRIP